MDRKELLINGAIIIVIIFIIYKLAHKVGETLGLADSEESIKIDSDLSSSIFDFNTIKKGDKVLPYKYAIQQATKIKNAFGIFNDDESTILGVFKQLDKKSEVKSLAYWYNKTFKSDLGLDLRKSLDDKEMNSILNYIKKLK